MKAARTVIADVAHSIEPLYQPRVWEELDAKFFATFWCLESGDLFFPSAAYQRQRHILRSQLDAIEQNSDLVGFYAFTVFCFSVLMKSYIYIYIYILSIYLLSSFMCISVTLVPAFCRHLTRNVVKRSVAKR